jgi:hypothetical protein
LLVSGCAVFDRTARDYRACEGIAGATSSQVGISEQIRQDALPYASARLGRDLYQLANLQEDLETGSVVPSPALLRQIEQLTTRVSFRCSDVAEALGVAGLNQNDPGTSAPQEPGGNQNQSEEPPIEDSDETEDGSDAEFAGSLDGLRVEPETRSGYDRVLFEHWIDADGDGCDTRREVLIQESLAPVTVGAGCDISGGTWISLYDGFTSSDPSDFDIDHMVPLAEAWDSGAGSWSDSKRRDFANDLSSSHSLIAVSGSSNRSKSDGDPADWLPPNSAYVCEYVQQWVLVKQQWNLSADQSEAIKIDEVLARCQTVQF